MEHPVKHVRFPNFAWLQWPLGVMGLGALIFVSPLVPFRMLSGTGYHDGQRMATSLYCLLGGLVLILRLLQRQRFPQLIGKQVLLLFGLFWSVGFISSIGAYSPRHAFYEWASLAMLFLTGWMIATEVRGCSSKLIDRILLLCGAGCSLYIFQALVAYVSALVIGQQPDPRDLIVGFDNYRFLNHIQTISLPLLGILAARCFRPRGPIYLNPPYWFVILLLWWMLTFVSAGRGTFLGVWAGMLVVLASYPRQAWPWFRVLSLSCGAGLVAYLLLYWLLPRFVGLQPFGLLLEVAQRTSADPNSGRWPLWQRALELVQVHPWLGVGPLHFAHHSQDLKIAAHPHNAFLQIAAEWGLPALIALIALVLRGGHALQRAGRAILPMDLRNQTLFSAFAATGVSILVDSFVSGLVVMPASQLWITLYIGCAWGWAASYTGIYEPKKFVLSSGVCYGLAAGILMLLIFNVRGLWPEILDLPRHESESQALRSQREESHFAPRIWRAGYF